MQPVLPDQQLRIRLLSSPRAMLQNVRLNVSEDGRFDYFENRESLFPVAFLSGKKEGREERKMPDPTTLIKNA